jgi:hypothetical protein
VAASVTQGSRDGKSVLYSDAADVWQRPLKGGPPKWITNFADQVAFYFDLSTDGKTLAVTRSVLTRDLVMINVK